jgi:RND family efflux transporter MFP subunit
MLKKKIRLVLIGAAAVAALALVALGLTMAERPSPGESSAGMIRPVAVEVTPVAREALQATISAVGTTAGIRDVVVASETAGRVTRVFVKVGDAVKQGETLISVDDELKAIALEQARAQLLAAETSLKKAQKDYERSQSLLKTGDVADVELEGFRLAYFAAEAQEKTAQAGLKYAERQLSDTRIKAPISGVVASRRVEVGEMVSLGKEVANVVDLSTVKIRVSVAEDDIGRLRHDQPVSLQVDARPGEVFTGRVYTIGSKPEAPNQHTYPVEVVVGNRIGHPLMAGMFARVEFQTGGAEGALSISKESLLNEDLQPSVFVVTDGIAHLRLVKLGIRAGERCQVLEGLREGDLVVSFGQKSVKDGTPVQYR